MTAEDRAWYIERLKEENKKQEAANSAPTSAKGYRGSEFK